MDSLGNKIRIIGKGIIPFFALVGALHLQPRTLHCLNRATVEVLHAVYETDFLGF